MTEAEDRQAEEVEVTLYEGPPDNVPRTLENGAHDEDPNPEYIALEDDEGEPVGGLEVPPLEDGS